MLFKKNIENLAAFGGGRIYSQNIDFKNEKWILMTNNIKKMSVGKIFNEKTSSSIRKDKRD